MLSFANSGSRSPLLPIPAYTDTFLATYIPSTPTLLPRHFIPTYLTTNFFSFLFSFSLVFLCVCNFLFQVFLFFFVFSFCGVFLGFYKVSPKSKNKGFKDLRANAFGGGISILKTWDNFFFLTIIFCLFTPIRILDNKWSEIIIA